MGGLEDSRADGVPPTPIYTKLFENVDGFLVRLLSSFFLPVLMLTSIYFTTFTHDLEVDHFEVNEPNLIGKEEMKARNLRCIPSISKNTIPRDAVLMRKEGGILVT